MKPKVYVIKRIWPLLVSAGSASVMLLAFFIPSIQDQWDRYQARAIIQQYVTIGDDFVSEKNYKMAEQAFSKAYELSEDKRLDIEVKRLSAKVNLIYNDPTWGSKPPEGLEEVDFQFLLHLKKGAEHIKERASILTAYGVYIASLGRTSESEKVLREAIALYPAEVLAYVNLGNLMDEMGKKTEAEDAYRQAIRIDPCHAEAHYNLGLLFVEQEKFREAEKEFTITNQLNPQDTDAISQLELVRKEYIK